MRMLIYGTGRLGHQVLHLITTHFGERCTVAGFVDDRCRAGDVVAGSHRVLGDLDTVARFPATGPRRICLVPALDPDDQPARGLALDRARRLGYQFPIIVHPDASVETLSVLGAGVIVQAGVLVRRSVQVADFCHLDAGAIVGAGSYLEENVHLSAGVTLGERVRLGRDVTIGLHATVTRGVTVNAGAVVTPHMLVDADYRTNGRLVPITSRARPEAASAVVFDEVSRA